MNKQGVLLVNLGSPDSPSVGDVRKYLREFLMDKRVLDTPFFIRAFVVYGCILPFRPKQSAEAYEKIWQPEGSPLVISTRRVRDELQRRVPIPIEWAMRYQHPSIQGAIRSLQKQGVTDLLLVPLFPHYAMSSYESAVERTKELVKPDVPGMSLTIVPPFYDQPDYIEALVASASDDLSRGYDHLLFSFHGLPERHMRKADPAGRHCLAVENCCQVSSPSHATCYRAQCFKTVEAFVKKAGVAKYSVAFQSRLGREPWLKPYTDHELVRLPGEGIKRLLVICPAFVSDCLETLEEIAMRGRDTYLQAGGREFALIPCLNEHPLWIQTLEKMVSRFTKRT